MSDKSDKQAPPAKPGQGGLYLALIVAGFIMLGHAFGAFYMWKVTARLGIAVLATALILYSAGDPRKATLPLAILWIAVAL
ncbi:MAG TPA: hypothetical protein VLB27_09320, partial [candidate division Zixibacteria bacterium]|nr:hypothetical protein [candidate division Zixibacteria bacterium]